MRNNLSPNSVKVNLLFGLDWNILYRIALHSLGLKVLRYSKKASAFSYNSTRSINLVSDVNDWLKLIVILISPDLVINLDLNRAFSSLLISAGLILKSFCKLLIL